MIISGTGHRELPFKEPMLVDLAKRAIVKANGTMVLSGMAQGWDAVMAKAAVSLGIPFKAICPFKGQGSNWPESAKKVYLELLSKAVEVIYTSDAYHKHCFFVRDRYLVDKSELLLAMWDGREQGGTFYTVKYAKEKEHLRVNLWDAAQKLTLLDCSHQNQREAK
jgi:uncharacterized phage-like protein YoqJ